MASKIVLAVLLLVAVASAELCAKPKVTSTSTYSTPDTTEHSDTVLTVSFNLECNGAAAKVQAPTTIEKHS